MEAHHMNVPLEITYRGTEKTPEIDDFIRSKAKKLDKMCDHITSCRIAIEQPQRHQSQGNPYRVRIQLRVPPGHELVVKKETSRGDLHDPLSKVVSQAFDSVSRQLRELMEKQQGDVKRHEDHQTMGVVVSLFHDESYGFLKALDTGKEVYFHRNSVIEDDFDRLEIGTGVRFAEEAGEKGPQASTVAIVDKPGHRTDPSEETELDVPLGWEGTERQ